jgi:hypothetical protein
VDSEAVSKPATAFSQTLAPMPKLIFRHRPYEILNMEMKIDKLILTLPIVVFGLYSCEPSAKNDNKPDMNLAMEFGIDSTQLVYQYYQKFGFTDICEDLRMVSKMTESPNLNKKLPINADDLMTINEFSNKVDSIKCSTISFTSNTRGQFYDMELDFVEFSPDSLLTIQLTDGEYEIIQTELTSTLKIFDSELGLFYVESHRCDGR